MRPTITKQFLVRVPESTLFHTVIYNILSLAERSFPDIVPKILLNSGARDCIVIPKLELFRLNSVSFLVYFSVAARLVSVHSKLDLTLNTSFLFCHFLKQHNKLTVQSCTCQLKIESQCVLMELIPRKMCSL